MDIKQEVMLSHKQPRSPGPFSTSRSKERTLGTRLSKKIEYLSRLFEYTAISIYVVGSKPQAYKTRPKGNMGS